MMMEPKPDKMRHIEKITRNIPQLVLEEQNATLLHLVDIPELEEAARKMKLGTTPGPDGFTTNFFHNCWDLIKEEVLQIIEDSRHMSDILKAFNEIILTLIPKQEGVELQGHFSVNILM